MTRDNVIHLTSVDALMGFIQDHHQTDLLDTLPLGVVQLLVDLQKLCDLCGVDFERAMRSAQRLHQSQKPQDNPQP